MEYDKLQQSHRYLKIALISSLAGLAIISIAYNSLLQEFNSLLSLI